MQILRIFRRNSADSPQMLRRDRRNSALLIQSCAAEIVRRKVKFGLITIHFNGALRVGGILVDVDATDMLQAVQGTAVVDFGRCLSEFSG